MQFESAWLWLLAPPLLAYAWWLSRRSYAQLQPRSQWASLAVRAVVLLLLIGAASRPAWLQTSTARRLVFALDVSRSATAENLDAAMADIHRMAREAFEAGGQTRVSVVAFGQDASLIIRDARDWNGWTPELSEKLRYQATLSAMYAERTRVISSGGDNAEDRSGSLQELQQRIVAVESFRDRIAGQRTNVENALRLAVNCGTSGEQRALYVFTDGNFNQGRWQTGWTAAAATGAPVHVVAFDKPQPPEVATADLVLPPSVRINEGFTADLRIASTGETQAELRVFKDGFAEQQREIELKPGENMVKLPGLYFREKGFHTIEVSLRPAADTQLANNTIRSLVIVPGESRVLYVDGDEKQTPYLKSALELEGMLVEARPASGVPHSLSELLSFDAFILCNVPADRLSPAQMQMIRTYVQDFGGGFIMLGGDESFGLGGYYNTPVEEVLPVRMPIQKDLIRPSLALMLVIDKSGSMDGVKIQLAKRAAISSAEAINPRDQIGVVGFDSASRVLLELTPAGDRATITSHIAGLDAGGGTFLYPAMADAQQRLVESNARKKHVIILSDGQTQGFGYEEMAQSMAADGITVSTVGIGEGADMKLMESIANAAGGRTYFTNDFYSIPQIFTREALRASKNMLVERLVQPVAMAHDSCLDEIDTEELPVLTGYVATTPKQAAGVILASDSGDPLLAKWRYGLGRTVAFTSEPKPRWAEDWLEWEDFAKFWSQLVRSVTNTDVREPLAVECAHYLGDDGVTLVADVRDSTGNFSEVIPELTTLRGGRSRPLSVTRAGAGLFEAKLPEITYGKDQQFLWRFPASHAASTGTTISSRVPTGNLASSTKTRHPADEHAASRGSPPAEPRGTNGGATGAAAVDSEDDAADPSTGRLGSNEDESGAAAADSDQTVSYGFAYSFSPEFATLGPATSVLEAIKSRGQGEHMSVGSSRLVIPPSGSSGWVELWPYLLAAALLLVPLDILIRRTG